VANGFNNTDMVAARAYAQDTLVPMVRSMCFDNSSESSAGSCQGILHTKPLSYACISSSCSDFMLRCACS
jgi:hypothetical protein